MANRVATIILNRPDKLNARTALIEREVSAAMGSAEEGQRHPSHRFDGRWLGLCAGVDMSLPSAVAEHGLDDQGREQVLRNGTNRREEPALLAPDQTPSLRGYVSDALGSFRRFRARDDVEFPD